MKLAFVSSYPPSHCGIGEYTRMLVASLKSLNPGIEAYYVFSDISAKKEPWLDDHYGAIVYPTFVRGSGRGLERIVDMLSEIGGVDVLHIQHDYSLYGYDDTVLRVAEKARDEGLAGKIVVTMHTVHHPYSDEKPAVRFQQKLNTCDAVIVHSHLQEFELRNQGVSPLRIERIPHGTLLNPYLGYPRMKLVESLGLDGERLRGPVIVVSGFLKWDKGLDVLLEALRILKPSRREMTVVVAGEIWDKRVLEYLDGLREVANLVFWEKYLDSDEILQLNALADIILLPYKSVKFYSVSGMLHLSMGSLKPILGTRVPKLVELYQHAPRVTIPPGDPQALARKLKWVVRNYDIIVPYMSFLYSYAVRTQWHRMAQRHLNLYIKLLRKKPRPTAPPRTLMPIE